MSRALVLGGGGLAGIAWEVGLLVGLADGGVDVAATDRVIGTSAGSVVGTLVATGVDLPAVHARHLEAAHEATATPAAGLDLEAMGAAFAEAAAGARDSQDMRARIGAWAMRTESGATEQERKDIVAGRLPVQSWPDRDLRVTAVDAGSGEAVTFGPGDGVDLVDAVAASCAVPGVWPPVTIGARRYMDGGVASVVHVDLADRPRPADRVLVVAPLDPPAGGPFPSVAEEVERRRRAHPEGAALAVLADESSREAFGPDVLDPASMPAAARAGRAQGAAAAAEAARLWGV